MPFQLASIAVADLNGRLTSLIAAVQGLGTALAPPLAGIFFDTHGADAVAAIGLISIFLSLACFLIAKCNSDERAADL